MSREKERAAAVVAATAPETENPVPVSWPEIIALFGQRAKECNRFDRRRVDRAVTLLLEDRILRQRHWFWHPTETGTMYICASGHGYYPVNGACPCADAQRHGPAHWCKHRIARAIVIRALEYIESLPPAAVLYSREWTPSAARQAVVNADRDPARPAWRSRKPLWLEAVERAEERAARDTALPVQHDRSRSKMWKD